MDSARDKILARLKEAQLKRGEIREDNPDLTSPIYHPIEQSPELAFKFNLESIGGQVILCPKSEVSVRIEQLCAERNEVKVFCTDPEIQKLIGTNVKTNSDEQDFLNMKIAVTGCEFLVAHLGSVLVSSAQISGRRMNVYPETHIVIASQNQLTNYLEEALENLRIKYKNELPSLISNITGPSRTADIEKTLVMGMHGPKSLIVIITEESI